MSGYENKSDERGDEHDAQKREHGGRDHAHLEDKKWSMIISEEPTEGGRPVVSFDVMDVKSRQHETYVVRPGVGELSMVAGLFERMAAKVTPPRTPASMSCGARILEGLEVLASVDPGLDTCAEHDEFFVNGDFPALTEAQTARLVALGWRKSDGGWAHFT